MSQRAVDALFHASFILCELRVMLRENAPRHTLNMEEKVRARKLLETMEADVLTLREDLQL